ncbi:RNA helicase CrhR [Candidatus Calditenuaceae archaeon HR02]|nr:RNA helicase CrhR [Candidatus Calditenuaceae archaeon HR02]
MELLCRPVVEAVRERFGRLAETQRRAIPHILRGENVLIVSPTGTGKTEAALLPILSTILTDPSVKPISTLYITPLRALNRDLLDRLEWWSRRLDISVSVRHGDTPQRERRIQALSPPQIMIATPEALQSLLIGRVIRRSFTNLRWVVVDEVHELATDKRGAQLAVALQRLRRITGKPFQLIGLSATVGEPEEVARFLTGPGGRFVVVETRMPRPLEVDVVFPEPSRVDVEMGEAIGIAPDVAARMRAIVELISNHSSTLIFTNTRPLAEALANRFKAWDEALPISIHHGSLSRDHRVRAEKDLKYGEVQGLICTSSLEMGIDVGRIDLCIQYNSPREVTRLIQRIGRSGHRIGGTARGVVIVMDSDDALEAVVIARKAKEGELEPVRVVMNSLDVAMHQIAGLLLEYGRLSREEIASLLRGAYNFSSLEDSDLEMLLKYMETLGIARIVDGTVTKPIKARRLIEYYFDNLSMIPEEKQYLVVEEASGEPVGILDEAFVAEYGEVGTRFILAGRAWVILTLSGTRIYVARLKEGEGAVPSWVGDEIPVPLDVAMEVGSIRRRYLEARMSGVGPGEAAASLASAYGVSPRFVEKSLREVEQHIEMGIPVPTDKLAVVEETGEYVILHITGGLRINRTLARLLSVYLAERIGAPVSAQSDPYRLVLKSKNLDAADVEKALSEILDEELLRRAVESSGVFRRRLVHVARKMGVVSKDVSLLDVSAQMLVESLRGTPAYIEALRFTIFTDYDWEGVKTLLGKIRSGDIGVVACRLEKPSPLASLTINRYQYEYETYTPERMHKLVINAVRGRINSELVVLACLDCRKYVEMVEVGGMDNKPVCPNCGSSRVGIVSGGGREDVERIMRGRTAESRRFWREAEKTAPLIEKYGKAAAFVLSAKGVGLREAEQLLAEEPRISPKLIEKLIELEKKALLREFS